MSATTEAMRDWIYAGQLLGLLGEDTEIDQVQIRLRDGADRDAGTTVVISGASGERAAGDVVTRTVPDTETRGVYNSGRSVVAKVLSYGGSPDKYGTTWSSSTFQDSLARRLPSVCWSHDRSRVIGKVVDYHDESDGLVLTMQLADPEAVPDARMAAALLSDGCVSEWSIGFADAVMGPDPQVRGAMRVKSASLVEVSPVVAGAVAGTKTLSVRARGNDPVADALLTIERALARSGGPIASTGPTAATAGHGTAAPDVVGTTPQTPTWLARRTATPFRHFIGPAETPALIQELATQSIVPPLDPRNLPTLRPAEGRLYFRANRTVAYVPGDDVPDDERHLLMGEDELAEILRRESAANKAKADAANRQSAERFFRFQRDQAERELAALDGPAESSTAEKSAPAVGKPERRSKWWAA